MSDQKTDVSEKNVNAKRGERLRECRKLRNMSQDDLLDELARAYGSKKPPIQNRESVSKRENGHTPIDWNDAHMLGDILHVNPAYLMCESDQRERSFKDTIIDPDATGARDRALLQLLLCMFHFIRFQAIRLFSADETPILVHPNDLIDFSFLDWKATMTANGETFEIAITNAILDGVSIDYQAFVFLANRLYSYINYALASVPEIREDLEIAQANRDWFKGEIKDYQNKNKLDGLVSNALKTIDPETGKTIYLVDGLDL